MLAGIVTLLACVVWMQVRIDGGVIGPYDLFPLFGLLAFGLMWTHYVTGAVRRLFDMQPGVLSSYFKITGWIVLLLLLLHPTIFLVQLWADGLGLPPFSYLSVYNGIAERLALMFGVLALFSFLAFEMHRKFRSTAWWKYVEYANLAAMGVIFYHALVLGGELDQPWYRAVWIVYGVLLVAAVMVSKSKKRRRYET